MRQVGGAIGTALLNTLAASACLVGRTPTRTTGRPESGGPSAPIVHR